MPVLAIGAEKSFGTGLHRAKRRCALRENQNGSRGCVDPRFAHFAPYVLSRRRVHA
jgi:hypothetical protein